MSKLIQDWYNMIGIKSISGQEKELADYIAKRIKEIGLKANYSYFPSDNEKQRPSIWTLLKGNGKGKRIMLIGHIDTVEVAEGWKTDPFTPTVSDKNENIVYGLGAMDMKGGIAAILDTLEYYSKNKDELNGEIIACFVADEEVLSQGTYQLAEEGITADYAIMAECRFESAAIGFRGRYSFDINIKGEAGHTSLYPTEGLNSLILASKYAIGIEDIPPKEDENLGSGSWIVRYIEGGHDGTLVVPEECYILADRFLVTGEEEKDCIEELTKLAKELGIEDNVEIKLRPRDSNYMRAFALDEDDFLVCKVKDAYKEVVGKELKLSYDPSVCDSNILAVDLGIPTITLGPSGGNMHAANEYGRKDQVEMAADIYKKVVKDILD